MSEYEITFKVVVAGEDLAEALAEAKQLIGRDDFEPVSVEEL